MAIYFEFDSGDQVQVASNSGWGDLRRFAETQQLTALDDLFTDGMSDGLSEVQNEFQRIAANCEDETVCRTIQNVIDVLAAHGSEGGAVAVTNGMESDGEDA